MATNESVKVFGMWASAYATRVEWALKLKGVEYEYQHEDLPNNKSEELLRYNPITKKVPVLVHNGKPLAESLVIVEYIDETWKDGYSIMPRDSYERAQARFWAKFSDDKVVAGIITLITTAAGEKLQKAIQELQANLKTLEEVLKDKKFFGGESIGFLDIALGLLPLYVPMAEDLVNVDIINDKNLPLLHAWFKRFHEVEIVKECLPPKDKLFAFNKARREVVLSGQT